MELPRRAKGDEFAPAGQIGRVLQRTAQRPGLADLPVACFYPFDFRTRLLPFIFYDSRMLPAGLRAAAAAFHDAGFTSTRAIFQLWNPNVRPSACRINGRPLQILGLSTMQIHSQPSYELIADAHTMGPDRPLIIAGGPKAIYQPEHYFGITGPGRANATGPLDADVVCTGEELVLAELLDRITEHRCGGETMLTAFRRCRDARLLDDIPGLVYSTGQRDSDGRLVLIDTGIQRLVRNMDELPHPLTGFSLIEPPHRRRTLAPRPLAENAVHKHCKVAAIITTHGCKGVCSYCPIPAYNQRTWRHKSPQRLVEEIKAMRERLGIRHYFGTDDNFFNRRETVESICTAMASASYNIGGRKRKPTRAIRFSTEATQRDVLRNRDLLPLARQAGMWGLWFGIEDLAGDLVNKGQTPERTTELFNLLSDNMILPMAMMMYHDRQPLRTGPGDMRGLLNQAAFLFRAGAASYQCTLHGPSVGSREYEDTFRTGTVIHSVSGQPLPDAFYDGNHVVATSSLEPARIHWNMLLGYLTFYNPVNLAKCIWPFNPDRRKHKKLGIQVIGMAGLAVSVAKSLPWLAKMSAGRIKRWLAPPANPHVIRSAAEI